MKIALLNDYQGVAQRLAPWAELPPETELRIFHDRMVEPGPLVDRLLPFDIVMAMRERTPFPRSTLERLPNLKLLATSGMRNAAIDVEAATELGILVCGTAGALRPTMEITWGLIFAVMRRIPQEARHLREGGWQSGLGVGLEGKTLGLAGLGNIGAQMAEVAQVFRMNVLAWSENLTEERAAACGARRVDKDDLLRQSDVLSIHLRLSERTRGLFGKRELALMKPTAFLINSSRGPIVDEAALIEALRRNAIAGAGLDVFDEEPLPAGHPLPALDNVVALPHLGYVTEEVYALFYGETLDNIQGYLRGDFKRVVNPDVLTRLRK